MCTAPTRPTPGKNSGALSPDSLKGLIPKFLPDVHDVRRDFSDYLGEVLALDLMLGVMLEELEASGELDNTVIVLSGDHGIPGIPRGKTNCYDLANSGAVACSMAQRCCCWQTGQRFCKPDGRRADVS